MSQQVDSQTTELGDGESASITLSWDTTNPDDIGDYIATTATEDDSDTTSVTVENVTFHRFVEAVSPGGAASASRAGASDRSAVAAGAGVATVSRSVTADRSLAARSRRGVASVSRVSVTNRATTAVSPGGSASIVRTVTVSSRRVEGSGSGDATVTRVGVLQRDVEAASPGGDGSVSRTTTAERFVVGAGSGRAIVVWGSPTSWQLPTDTDSGRRILVTPATIETDHDQLTLSAQISSSILTSFDRYRRSGDVDREETAFGAFRRVPRDDRDLLTLRPPTEMSPPFDDRQVAPIDFSASEASPGRYDIEIELGLEEPRAREPLERDVAPIEVDSSSLALDVGETGSMTLSWTPAGSDVGDWLATARSDSDSDDVLVTVSDAPWTLAFPVASLGLRGRQVGQLEQSHDTAVPSVSIPARLDGQQAAVLLAVGSRVEATRVRSVPDAGNVAVDTLPDEELTCEVATPSSELEDGTYVLAGWDMTRDRFGPRPYDATIELVQLD